MKRSIARISRSPTTSRWNRVAASRRPRRPTAGFSSTTTTSTWRSAPTRAQPEKMIVNEMRRDSNNIRQGDSLGFSFDTFLDKRNAMQFEVNVLGGRTDGQSTNERQYNGDWNPVWRVWASRFAGGWSIEAMIPFKSIRYRPGRLQTWGFQTRRISKWKNEVSYLTKVPPALGMGRADFSASLYATVVGLEAPRGRTCHRSQAVHHRQPDDRPRRHTAAEQRSRRRCRGRRQIQHAEPDRRFHGEHRLRPGGGGRAAGEPDALLIVLSREARLLPREPRHVHLQRRLRPSFERVGDEHERRLRRHADHVLQSPHRPRSERRPADSRRRPVERTGRPVLVWSDRHPDARVRRQPVDELLRRPRSPGHPAAQQRRRDVHRPFGHRQRQRSEPDVRRRRHVRVLRQPRRQHLLGADEDRRTRGRRHQSSRLRRLLGRPLRPAAREPAGRRQLQSRGRVPPPRQHAENASPRRASARARAG